MEFTNPIVAKITAQVADSTEKVSINGVTADSTTVENAKSQIDKLLNIVNKSVYTAGMTRTIIQEATENG